MLESYLASESLRPPHTAHEHAFTYFHVQEIKRILRGQSLTRHATVDRRAASAAGEARHVAFIPVQAQSGSRILATA